MLKRILDTTRLDTCESEYKCVEHNKLKQSKRGRLERSVSEV